MNTCGCCACIRACGCCTITGSACIMTEPLFSGPIAYVASTVDSAFPLVMRSSLSIIGAATGISLDNPGCSPTIEKNRRTWITG